MFYLYMGLWGVVVVLKISEDSECFLIVQRLDLQVKHSQLTLTQLNSLLSSAPSPGPPDPPVTQFPPPGPR